MASTTATTTKGNDRKDPKETAKDAAKEPTTGTAPRPEAKQTDLLEAASSASGRKEFLRALCARVFAALEELTRAESRAGAIVEAAQAEASKIFEPAQEEFFAACAAMGAADLREFKRGGKTYTLKDHGTRGQGGKRIWVLEVAEPVDLDLD